MQPTLSTLTTFQAHYPYVPVMVKQQLAEFDAVKLTAYLRQRGTSGALTIQHQQTISYFNDTTVAHLTATSMQLTSEFSDGHTTIQPDINAGLQTLLTAYQTPRIAGLPPFTGGLLGYFSYEYAQRLVPHLTFKNANPHKLPLLDLVLTTRVIFYDHQHHEIGLTQLIPTTNLATAYEAAAQQLPKRLAEIMAIFATPAEPLPPLRLTSALKNRQTQAHYATKVDQIRQHIVAGDIFQLIYANPQVATMTGSLLPVYANLPATSPYQFYYQHGDFETVVASPETLVTKQGTQIATYPLAGTRRRGRDAAEDAKLAHELTTNPKEIAEHNMLVDLGRNDLGRVAKFKSVRVTNLRQLLKFSQVMHLGSRVAAEVDEQVTALQTLAATFPAGTLSGAPKVRAMELIDEFETETRGIYGGCFGYLDCNGDLDMAIGIRLAYRQREHLVIPAGAGIVADSIGTQEFKECQNKERALAQTVTQVAEVAHGLTH
ncbi:anthranilate synthase component I [Lactobacillus pentosus] [Lactiplantibacillus mudanjiangensis]|uniref:anthranilate synthase component I family protein n=1 Tax=Lactiplantibacillus mudanjiangensis TaxID=1296538 RepID=UPI0010140967|nr:anthranilate synthase component I family protein [Lactiplantibacillus mudanjiangensis]VDG33684.1 anthranilate synthase component I [Lactobacillus pentosus] [Lactiplantibacillus mudanjiangensis]